MAIGTRIMGALEAWAENPLGEMLKGLILILAGGSHILAPTESLIARVIGALGNPIASGSFASLVVAVVGFGVLALGFGEFIYAFGS